MSFTTLNFIAFLAVFLAAYYLLPSKFQNLVLLVGNYIFYMLGSVWSGLLLFVATLVSFLTARAIQAQWLGKKRLWVVLGAGYILGQLLLLKYLGFFFQRYCCHYWPGSSHLFQSFPANWHFLLYVFHFRLPL